MEAMAKEQERTNDSAMPYWDAVAMHEDAATKKTRWTRVGRAFVNRDGSYTVYLDALPTGGKMQLRPHRELRWPEPPPAQGAEPWSRAPQSREIAR